MFGSDAFFILIHLLQRDSESAVAAGRAVSKLNPPFSSTCKPYLSALGHSDTHTVSRSGAPVTVGDRTPPRPERFIATSAPECGSDRDHFAEGEQIANVPEDGSEAVAQSQDQKAH